MKIGDKHLDMLEESLYYDTIPEENKILIKQLLKELAKEDKIK